jgi:RNA polymerase sigma-70 factor (ECF subfamily)
MTDLREPDQLATRLAIEAPWLVRLASRLTRDAADAEDLVSETVMAAWRRRGQLRDPAALRGWLRRSLVNRVIDRARRQHVELLDFASVEADWRDDDFTVDPEAVLERAELRDELEDALVRLPVIYRIPVVLHDALDWSGPEVAQAMGIGLPAAKQRIRRGRMMMVHSLAADDARRHASLAQPMRCWRARRLVSGYLDEELQPREKLAVEEHLAGCPTCPPLYASLVGIRDAMGALRDPDSVVEEEVAARIMARTMGSGSRIGGRVSRRGPTG